MAFSGTMVAAGQASGVVVATGPRTELGRISDLLASVEPLTTPLLRQVDRFGRRFQQPWRHGTAEVKEQVLARLRDYLEGIMLRREKRQALRFACNGCAKTSSPGSLSVRRWS